MTDADLHPYFDLDQADISFWLPVNGRIVTVKVSRETLAQRFRVPAGPHGMLMAYESNRECLDAAVVRRAFSGAESMQVQLVDFVC